MNEEEQGRAADELYDFDRPEAFDEALMLSCIGQLKVSVQRGADFVQVKVSVDDHSCVDCLGAVIQRPHCVDECHQWCGGSILPKWKPQTSTPDSCSLLTLVRARSQNGEPVDVPMYDFTTHSRCATTQRMDPADVVIVEGILVLHMESIRSVGIDLDLDPAHALMMKSIKCIDRSRSNYAQPIGSSLQHLSI